MTLDLDLVMDAAAQDAVVDFMETVTRFVATSRRTAYWRTGLNSNNPSEPALLDYERDLPTTPDDVRVLRELHRQTPSWLDLGADEIDALLPPGALERRPPMSSPRRPSSLE